MTGIFGNRRLPVGPNFGVVIDTISMNIIITKNEIEEALKRESSLISKGAFTANGENLHEALYIDEHEFKVLESAYIDALSVITSTLCDFLAVEPRLNELGVELSLRKSYPEMEGAIKGDILSYMVKRVVALWLTMVHPELTAIYEKAAVATLNNLIHKLYYKAPPLR